METFVRCGGGLTVFQRGSSRPPSHMSALEVGPVRVVTRPGFPPVEAHSADHVLWRRHWAEPDRLVIEFVDVADVEVDRQGVVTFDRHLTSQTEQHLLLDHVLPLYLANRGALVVHGGVVGRRGRGVVIVGSSGAGKSTLTAYCWQNGWTIGGDDGAVLWAGPPATVEPTYSTIRLLPDAVELLELNPAAATTVLHKYRVADDGTEGLAQRMFDLAAIVVIEPGVTSGEVRWEELRGIRAHAELFGSTFHSDFSRDRHLPEVVDAIAGIIDQVPVARVEVPRGLVGLQGVEQFLRELVESSEGNSEAKPKRPLMSPHSTGCDLP